MNDSSLDLKICEEIHELVMITLNEELSDQQRERLDDLVCSSPAAREYYRSCIQVNLDLNIWASGPPAEFSELELSQGLLTTADSPTLGFLGSSMKRFGNFVVKPANFSVLSSVFIITVSLILLGQIYFNNQREEKAAVAVTPPEVNRAELVAKVTKLHECTWAEDSPRKYPGATIYSGETLSLEKGYADITFLNGVVVRLDEGAQYRFEKNNISQLLTGRMTAYVPPGAEGFTVLTNAAKVVDLGTEFGVNVDENLTSNVHVFKGKVTVSPTAKESVPADTKTLSAGDSISISTAGQVIARSIEAKSFKRPEYRPPLGKVLYADQFNSDSNIPFAQRLLDEKGVSGSIAKRSLNFFKTAGDCRLIEFTNLRHRGLLQLGSSGAFSPQYNFNTAEIEQSGGIAIELELSLTGDNVDRELHWFGLRLLAASEKERIGPWQHLKGVHFHIRGSGVYSLHDAGKRQNAMNKRPRFTSHTHRRWHKLRIEIQCKKFDGKTPAKIVAYANDSTKPFLKYKTKTGFKNNFIALDYENASRRVNRSGLVDWMKVSLLNDPKLEN